MKIFPLVLLMMAAGSFTTGAQSREFDVQGHRGCRGLLPENSVPAFLKALDLGVSTLEMDLVISGDRNVIVSHEPFFSHEISTRPDGNSIKKGEELLHNLFELDYAQIEKYDVGLKPHRRFPDQQKIPVAKPLFTAVVQTSDNHAQATGRPLPYYNIEIKRRPEWDERFHPPAPEFASLVVDAVRRLGIEDRTFIQSFDKESLQICRKLAPEIPLVLLVENSLGFQANLEELGFSPAIYSPAYQLVNAELVAQCKAKGMLLIPWTANDRAEMERLIELGVNGIITDYPDRLMELVGANRALTIKR